MVIIPLGASFETIAVKTRGDSFEAEVMTNDQFEAWTDQADRDLIGSLALYCDNMVKMALRQAATSYVESNVLDCQLNFFCLNQIFCKSF